MIYSQRIGLIDLNHDVEKGVRSEDGKFLVTYDSFGYPDIYVPASEARDFVKGVCQLETGDDPDTAYFKVAFQKAFQDAVVGTERVDVDNAVRVKQLSGKDVLQQIYFRIGQAGRAEDLENGARVGLAVAGLYPRGKDSRPLEPIA